MFSPSDPSLPTTLPTTQAIVVNPAMLSCIKVDYDKENWKLIGKDLKVSLVPIVDDSCMLPAPGSYLSPMLLAQKLPCLYKKNAYWQR